MIVIQGGLGDFATTQASLQKQLVVAVRAFNGKSFTAREVLPVLGSALRMAASNWQRAQELYGRLPENIANDAPRHHQQLEFLIKLMKSKGTDPYKFTAAHKTFKDVRTAVTNPIMWRSNMVATLKVDDEARGQFVDDIQAGILALPGALVAAAVTIVKKVVEEAVRPLLPKGNVPSWVFPVLVGGVALGVGTWLYGTLKKVTP
jgi:hypothetical protein